MNLLRDVHLPEPISYFPLAIGWWLLIFGLPILSYLIYVLYKRMTRKTAVKTAKKLLLQLKQETTKSDLEKLAEIVILIRRVAISVSPREHCASLTGQAWLAYLNQSLKKQLFTEEMAQYFALSYQKKINQNINLAEFMKVTECWLKVQK